jgi:hypothetical protein
MRIRIVVALSAVFALVLTGCPDAGELAPDTEPDPAPVEEDEPDVDEEADEAAEELVEDEGEAWQHLVEFDDPIVWEDSGVRLSFTGIGLNDVTHDDAPSDVVEFLDEDVITLIVVELTASNDSGTTIDFFPAQGEIHVGREQVESDLLLTDSFAGMDWRDGVDDTGMVVWALTQTSFEEAIELGELVYTASAPFDADTFDEVAAPVEVTVTW